MNRNEGVREKGIEEVREKARILITPFLTR